MKSAKKEKPNLPECPICQEVYKDPKVLPCGHSICLQCLCKMAPHGTRSFKCPLCQRETQVPNGDVRKLPTNFGLRDVVDGTGDEQPEKPPDKSGSTLLRNIAIGGAAAVGGLALTAAIPFVILPAIGFTSAGIAAGSTAAGLMSASAIASGGGVAAGSAVAVMQSVGAAGLAASTYAAAGATAGVAGYAAAEAATRFKKDGSADGDGNDENDDGVGVDRGNPRDDGLDGAEEVEEGARRMPGDGDEGTEVGVPQNPPQNIEDDDDDVELSKLHKQ